MGTAVCQAWDWIALYLVQAITPSSVTPTGTGFLPNPEREDGSPRVTLVPDLQATFTPLTTSIYRAVHTLCDTGV